MPTKDKDIQFRSKKKDGKTYTYPIGAKKKMKKKKRLVIKDEAKPQKTPAGFVRGADGKLRRKKIVIKI